MGGPQVHATASQHLPANVRAWVLSPRSPILDVHVEYEGLDIARVSICFDALQGFTSETPQDSSVPLQCFTVIKSLCFRVLYQTVAIAEVKTLPSQARAEWQRTCQILAEKEDLQSSCIITDLICPSDWTVSQDPEHQSSGLEIWRCLSKLRGVGEFEIVLPSSLGKDKINTEDCPFDVFTADLPTILLVHFEKLC